MKHTVEINPTGIFIDGRPKLLLCSSLFYFRIPEECWRDRMEKLKLCGYNCIDVYFPWNYHELSPGKWDFTGQRDAAAFLDLAAEMGLYVVARPGPYICSEWDGGGLPAFLGGEGLRTCGRVYLQELDRWMERILPVIAKRQLTAGGTVIMLQLENELDYFACGNPGKYIEQLVRSAQNHGISIPLTACAGQWDAEASTGWAGHVAVTYNVYMKEEEALFEDRCCKVQKKLYENGLPFLITETHRPHALLKRELCCGARLISPYNQTAGVNYDLFHGISNWSGIQEHFPLSYMATDYDFEWTMITAEGGLRDEALQARLLSGLINTFPPLSAGRPVKMEDIRITADFPAPQTVDEKGRRVHTVFGYEFDGGRLINLTNLSGHAGCAYAGIGGETLRVGLQPMETKLLPVNIPLREFGIAAALLWSEAEIAWIRPNTGACDILLYSDSPSRCRLEAYEAVTAVEAGGRIEQENGKIVLSGQNCEFTLNIADKPLRIMLYGRERAARLESPWFKEYVKPDEPVARNLPVLGACDIALPLPKEERPLQNLEKYGVYRGGGVYELDVEQSGRLILQEVADIAYIYHNGRLADVGHKSGETFILDVSPGKWTAAVESWGHSNFDDIRLPSLRMGSTKGIYSAALIRCEDDITDLYAAQSDRFPYEDTYRQTRDKIPALVSVNEIERPETPLCLSYSRKVYPPEGCSRFILNFDGIKAYAAVYIDGRLFKKVDPASPFVDISGAVTAGRTFELTLRVMKENGKQPVGRIYLLSGIAVEACRFAPMSPSYYLSLVNTEITEGGKYPLTVEQGCFKLAKLAIPHKTREARITFEGGDMELFCMLNGHVAGRILLPTDGFPQVRGGDPFSFTIPPAWGEDEPLTVLMCGIGRRPRLTDASITC